MAEKPTKTYITLLLLLLLIATQPALADDGEEEVGKDLGWLAIGAGVIATLPFNLYNLVRRNITRLMPNAGEIARRISSIYRPILHFHIAVNSLGALAAFAHGYVFLGYVDGISLALVIVISVVMFSGYLLLLASNKYSKIFNKLVHTQVIITILLILLTILHVITVED